MRGSDIPPPPGYRPTPLATLGQQLVRLGQAMQNPNTKLGELTELVQACALALAEIERLDRAAPAEGGDA